MSTLCFLCIYFQGFFGDSLAHPTSFPTFAIPTATKGAEKRVKNFKRKVLKVKSSSSSSGNNTSTTKLGNERFTTVDKETESRTDVL